MYIRKLLQRQDAVSVMIAVVLALIAVNFLTDFSYEPAMNAVEKLGGSEATNFSGALVWQDTILLPIIKALFQIVLLEASLRLLVPLRVAMVRRKK